MHRKPGLHCTFRSVSYKGLQGLASIKHILKRYRNRLLYPETGLQLMMAAFAVASVAQPQIATSDERPYDGYTWLTKDFLVYVMSWRHLTHNPVPPLVSRSEKCNMTPMSRFPSLTFSQEMRPSWSSFPLYGVGQRRLWRCSHWLHFVLRSVSAQPAACSRRLRIYFTPEFRGGAAVYAIARISFPPPLSDIDTNTVARRRVIQFTETSA